MSHTQTNEEENGWGIFDPKPLSEKDKLNIRISYLENENIRNKEKIEHLETLIRKVEKVEKKEKNKKDIVDILESDIAHKSSTANFV